MLTDLRFAVRMLLKNPGFTVAVVTTLALGIGANTAIFSLVSAVLLRSLPFHEPERLVVVWEDNSREGFPRDTPAPANFVDWQAQSSVFEDMAAAAWQSFNLTGNGDPERLEGLRVTANLLQVLGVEPVLGRTFLAEEDRSDASRVALISYGLWQRRFGRDPALVGQTVSLNGEEHTVVGILPARFWFLSKDTDLLVPAAFTPGELARRSLHYLFVAARLKPTISLRQAQGEMTTIAHRLEQRYPETNKRLGSVVVAMRDQYAGEVRPALMVLLAAVGAVLLIACSNVAHLLLARGTTRRKEIALRAAIGAGRGRIIRQLLTESLVLAGLGATMGVIVSTGTLPFLTRLVPESLTAHLELDFPVLAFTAGIALLTGVLFGIGPALQAASLDLNQALKQGREGGASQGRLRSTLVVAEMTLTVMLLVAAALLLESYSRIRDVDPGFTREKLLTLQTVLPPSKYGPLPRRSAFYQEVLDRVNRLPGVISAGYVNFPPLTLKGGTSGFFIEGRPIPLPGQLPVQGANNRVVTSGYLPTMGIPLLRGRHFDQRDGPEASRVVVINQMMARTFWPNQDAVGRRIRFGSGGPEQPWFTIIGIVGDVKQMGLDVSERPEMYFPVTQDSPGGSFFWPRYLVVRTAVDPMTLATGIRRAILAVDPDQPVSDIRTMDEIVDREISQRRTQTTLLGAFAVLALVLASVGLYGVLSYSVAQRTPEIGLRMALGAERGRVIRSVLWQGLKLTSPGVCLGLVGAFALTRLMSALLFGVSPTDPVILVTVSLLLSIVAFLASYIPARRAANVDPLLALRYE